jgi:class 3 adenylate cyclase/tetratricopeptide (TPR) repeat protein
MANTPLAVGERRQLTVVFSDIVGSTELSGQLDPEDWHDIVRRYQQTASGVVKRFDGYVLQYLGDGVLILFGYPKANETDAERAVRAGLLLIEEIGKLNGELQRAFGKAIAIRVGVHTGEVMVGADEDNKGNVFGEAPNVAARVQTAADPNTVCISAATQRLVAGFFIVEDLGRHVLKGVPEPMGLYKVERASGVRSRLHAVGMSSLTPFIGREEEREALMHCWSLVQKGKGQLVMITGDAGIGKSRLLQQFKEDLGGIPHTWIEGESSPYEQDTPFAASVDLIENAFHWADETPVEQRIQDLEYSFALVGMDLAKSVSSMASLLSIHIPLDRYPPLLLSPEQQRTQLLHTLVDWVIGNARSQPTVLVMEDLHFADPSTLEEFVMLGDQIEDVPLLLLFTARPRFKPPWPTRPYHTLLALNRLNQGDMQDMIGGLLGKLIPKETLASLVARADGVPLFAEELSHAIAEGRAPTNLEKQIPASLNDLLMARLDYLGPVKEIAQTASVLGRSFSFSLLAAISGKSGDELHDAMDRLAESGLVLGERTAMDANYTFKHALVQESAYGSLLKSRRRELHRAVAGALDEKFPELVKQRPELVAHHLTEAGEAEKAVEAWQTAAEKASLRAAFAEAEKHYKKALEVLSTVPESPDRAQAELPLQIGLGHVVEVNHGFGSAVQEKVYQRARQIAQQLGDSPQFFFILLGLWSVTNSRSELNASQELTNEMVRIAEREGASMTLVWAYTAQALQTYGNGNFPAVGDWYRKIQEQYRPEEQNWAPFDPLVSVMTHTSLALWQLGWIDQARQKSRQQFELAQHLPRPNEAMARLGACSLEIYLRQGDSMLENANKILEIAEQEELPSFKAWGAIYSGIARILQGRPAEGLPQLTRGIAEYLATGTHASLGQYLSMMAEGYLLLGDTEQALATIENAFGAAPEEKMHFPELHRVRTDILWKKGNVDITEIEKGYRQAIAVSKEFGALTQELRAATHLGSLLQSQGRSHEARELLEPLFAKFAEGFDTPDLQEAKTQLDALSTAN